MRVFYLIAMVEKVGGEVTIRVESANEYREAVRNAESMGMEVTENNVCGEWRRVSDGTTHGVTNSVVDIDHVGREYFYIDAGEVFKCEPSNEVGEAGHVELTFR